MMDTKSLLATFSVIAAFLQYGIYTKDVLAHKTKPHAFSWFVWGLPSGIVFVAQLVSGGGAGTWATAITTLLCTLIFILSLFYGEKEITKLDWSSLGAALFSILLWVIVKDPLASVILITVIDIFGFIPTLRKSIKKPHEEPVIAYFIGGSKWVLSLGAMDTFSLTTVIYPSAMVLANWLAVALFLMRRAALAIRPK